MSYCVHPFAVRLEDVESLLGSNDLSLIPALKSEFPSYFEDPAWDDDPDLTREAALADLLAGNQLNPYYGDFYGSALELLCWHTGEFLSNRHWSYMHFNWFETVDDALRAAGVPFSLTSHLFFRGSPISIPEPGDFPGIGYILNGEIATTMKTLGKPLFDADMQVRTSVMEVRLWLATCRERRCDLVTFYH